VARVDEDDRIISCTDYEKKGGAVCVGCESLYNCDVTKAIDATLSARGAVYGSYPEQCRISQNIKRAMMDSPNWAALSDDKKEALEIIAVKMGRILNGDPEYADSWHDIAGYAKLVEDSLS
jgi:hypothetical protein